MTSHRKQRRPRPARGTRNVDAQHAHSSRRDAKRKQRIKKILFGTQRRVLASAGAVVTLTGAISGISGVLHKPGTEALDANFSAVTAYPEVSLEQYDARTTAEGTITGAPVKTGMVAYRLAADTTRSPSTVKEATQSTPTDTTTSPRAPSNNVTRAIETTPPSITTTITTTTTPTTTTAPTVKSPIIPHLPVVHPPQKRGKRPGAKITTTTPDVPFPTQRQVPPKTAVSSPPKRAFRHVPGALVTNGTGASQSTVNAVLDALSNPGAETEVPSSSNDKESTTTSTTPAPSPPRPGHSGSRSPSPGAIGEPRHVILPASCSSLCGATQEIDKALTYDPNPTRAAKAVAAIFNDSRGEVVGRRLYPIGAMVSYTINLDGFAHRKATLEWSLFATGGRRPPPKPWWRDVVVAHIEPIVNHESLAGTFWVPVPPERGDYVVHLVLLDTNGVPHATSDSTPDFH
jgi:hypothetical protein